MTIIITKTKLALGILAMVSGACRVASDGVFTDNPSGTYYHDPVEWAYDNGIIDRHVGHHVLTHGPGHTRPET